MIVKAGVAGLAGVAERAGIAAGTLYRYFASKRELLAAVLSAFCDREMAAIEAAANAAPGPLSAVAAAINACASRAVAQPRLYFAVFAETAPQPDALRAKYREQLVCKLQALIAAAFAELPQEEAALAARAAVGALIIGLVGPLAPADPAQARAQVQLLTLLILRALGIPDARARGLAVHSSLHAAR